MDDQRTPDLKESEGFCDETEKKRAEAAFFTPSTLVSPRWNDGGAVRKLRLFGCSVVLVVLCGLMYTAYSSLQGTVWSTFERVRSAVERGVRIQVPENDKARLLANIEKLDRKIREAEDPYPAMGRFVRAGYEALSDGVVDAAEVEGLNTFLERELEGEGLD